MDRGRQEASVGGPCYAGGGEAGQVGRGSARRRGGTPERTDPLHPPPPYTLKKCAPYFPLERTTPERSRPSKCEKLYGICTVKSVRVLLVRVVNGPGPGRFIFKVPTKSGFTVLRIGFFAFRSA